MLNPKIRFAVIACLMAVSLAGCDRGATGTAQGTPTSSVASDAAQTPGTIDRSFAGDPLPDVTVSDPTGTTLKLAALKGAPVLLNLWATWCAPCIKEMPQLNNLAGEMQGKLRIVTVSMDLTGAKAVSPFFRQHDLANLPRWMDPDNQLASVLGSNGDLPLSVLYNAQGKEVWRIMGGHDWSSEQARADVLEGVAAGG